VVGQDTGLPCDAATDEYCVAFEAQLDLDTRVVTWTWRTLDASTGEVPTDPFAGFLPPNRDLPGG
jgi:hypothetical protein